MIKSVMLTWYGGFEGGGIGDFLNIAAEAGFFSYILPFLLIFALVFGILSQTKIFQESRSTSGIIAFVVGLMALQFDFVPVFFSEIFPRMGVGLAILLVFLIFVGMFSDPDSGAMMWTMVAVSLVIAVIVLVNTAGSLGWSAGYWWYDNWEIVAMVVTLLVVMAIIIGGSKKDAFRNASPFAQALRGGK